MKIFCLILISFPILFGCAKKQTTAKLEVSRGFLVSGAGFDGGLIIVGQNTSTGERFSIDLQSGVSANMELSTGNWTFAAVGWDGGGSLKIFGGVPYCGLASKNLSKASETVALSVNTTNCQLPAFAAGMIDLSATPTPTFKKIGVLSTCNSFYKTDVLPSHNISTKKVITGDSAYYCDNLSLDMRPKTLSIKIFAVSKPTPGSAPALGMESPCLPADPGDSVIDLYSSGPYVGNSLRLPLDNIPFDVRTYTDTTCTNILAHYPFPNGLINGNVGEFDSLITEETGYTRFVLPGNEIRRAESPFIAILPQVKCHDGASEKKCPNLPASVPYEFHAYYNVGSQKLRLPVTSCGAITGIVGGPISFPFTSCNSIDAKYVEVTFTPAGTGTSQIQTSEGNFYVAVGTGSADTMLRDIVASSLVEALGPYNINAPVTFLDSFKTHDKDDDKKYFGMLSKVRQMLSAQGPGGAFPVPTTGTFAAACIAAAGRKDINFYSYKDNKFESYSAEVTTPNNPAGSYFCDIDDPNAFSCINNHNKRMKIYDNTVSTLTPVMVLEFNCQYPIGKMEVSETEIDGAYTKTEKEVIAWNTDPTSSLVGQRFDGIKLYTREFTVGGTLESASRRMFRFYKNSQQEMETWDFQFSSHLNGGGGYDQQMGFIQTATKTGNWDSICFKNQSVPFINNGDVFYYLTPANSTYLATVPIDGAPGDYVFQATSAWPQTSYVTPHASCRSFTGSPYSTIFGLPLTPQSLELMYDPGVYFGGTFFTDP